MGDLQVVGDYMHKVLEKNKEAGLDVKHALAEICKINPNPLVKRPELSQTQEQALYIIFGMWMNRNNEN